MEEDPIYVTVPCFIALSVDVPREGREGKSDRELIDEAMDAAYDYWEQLKWPDAVHHGDCVAMLNDNGSDCGPLLKLSEGNVTYVTPTSAEVDR